MGLNAINIGDAPQAPIIVSGSFGGVMFFPYQAIAKQITINAADLGGDWNGDVYHDGIAIGPGESQPNRAPYYEALSASIGGGAIGLILYNLHDVECAPDNGASIAANPTTTVVICHYGPVWWDPEETPFIIDWSEAGLGQWETLPQEDFTYTRAANHRDVTITAETEFDFKEGFDYRIRPNPGVLKCELGGNTINVASYTYVLHGS